VATTEIAAAEIATAEIAAAGRTADGRATAGDGRQGIQVLTIASAILFFACTICAAPYLLSYNTLALTCLAVMLLASGKLDALGQTLCKLAYWLPAIQLAFGQFHIPGPALIPAAFTVCALFRLNNRSAARTATQTVSMPTVQLPTDFCAAASADVPSQS
jgi:hypothetical protein